MRQFLSSTIFVLAVLTAALCQKAPGQAPQSKEAQSPETQSKDAQAREMKGMPPRAASGDYQGQAKAGAVTIAAEFTGHSVPTPEAIFSTEDYVVVEVGLFGPTDMPAKLALSDFALRINGKVMPSPAEPYARIFATLKDPEWEPPVAASSKGKTSVGSGGGGQDLNAPPPTPPKMPFELRRAMQQRVQKASLPEGDRALPVAGLIFFPYRGKPESIRTVELLYEGAAGKTVVTLHP